MIIPKYATDYYFAVTSSVGRAAFGVKVVLRAFALVMHHVASLQMEEIQSGNWTTPPDRRAVEASGFQVRLEVVMEKLLHELYKYSVDRHKYSNISNTSSLLQIASRHARPSYTIPVQEKSSTSQSYKRKPSP
jgi:hypothetical protein